MILALLAIAAAGTVYINGTRVDVLPVAQLEQVSVRFDEKGNIWIDAPRYQVAALPSANAAPLVGAASAPAGASGVPAGTWWLVTADDASVGHVVDVEVNGVVVQRVQSGTPQVILDLGPYLRPGVNRVRMAAQPGTPPSGGAFSIFVGTGSNQSGTLRIDRADIRYARTSADPPGGGTREFSVTVP